MDKSQFIINQESLNRRDWLGLWYPTHLEKRYDTTTDVNDIGAVSDPLDIAPTAEKKPEDSSDGRLDEMQTEQKVKDTDSPPDARSKDTALEVARNEEIGINMGLKIEIKGCPDNRLTCFIEDIVVSVKELSVEKVLSKSRQNPCCSQPLA